MKNTANQQTIDEAEKSPVAWFCLLEQARAKGDEDVAAIAREKLRQLGVNVCFGKNNCARGDVTP